MGLCSPGMREILLSLSLSSSLGGEGRMGILSLLLLSLDSLLISLSLLSLYLGGRKGQGRLVQQTHSSRPWSVLPSCPSCPFPTTCLNPLPTSAQACQPVTWFTLCSLYPATLYLPPVCPPFYALVCLPCGSGGGLGWGSACLVCQPAYPSAVPASLPIVPHALPSPSCGSLPCIPCIQLAYALCPALPAIMYTP